MYVGGVLEVFGQNLPSKRVQMISPLVIVIRKTKINIVQIEMAQKDVCDSVYSKLLLKLSSKLKNIILVNVR